MDGPKDLSYYINLFSDRLESPCSFRSYKKQADAIAEYIAIWPPSWVDRVKKYASMLPEMDISTRIVGLMPARNEQHRIVSALDAIFFDVETSGLNNSFELIILENGFSHEVGDLCEILDLWRSINYPAFSIHCIQHKWSPSEKFPIAKARKLLADISVYRIYQGAITHPVYLMSEDADIESIQCGRLRCVLSIMDKNPFVDALRGPQERGSNIIAKHQLCLLERRTWQFTELFLSDMKYGPAHNDNYNFYWNRVVTAGSNVLFSSEVYSSIHGYSDDIQVFEDMDIGQRISVLRGKFCGNRFVPLMDTICHFPCVEESSISRILHSLVQQEHVYCHNGDGFFDNDMIIKSSDSNSKLLSLLDEYAFVNNHNKNRFECLLSELYKEIERIVGRYEDPKMFFNRIMATMGISFDFYNIEADQIYISRVDSFREKLKAHIKIPVSWRLHYE